METVDTEQAANLFSRIASAMAERFIPQVIRKNILKKSTPTCYHYSFSNLMLSIKYRIKMKTLNKVHRKDKTVITAFDSYGKLYSNPGKIANINPD